MLWGAIKVNDTIMDLEDITELVKYMVDQVVMEMVDVKEEKVTNKEDRWLSSTFARRLTRVKRSCLTGRP